VTASSGRDIDPHLVQRATHRNLAAPLPYLLAIGASFLSNRDSYRLRVKEEKAMKPFPLSNNSQTLDV
jgi:hypothetical protein